MSGAPPGFQKAYLQIEGGERIDCLFNPREYQIQRQNTWKIEPVTGAKLPVPQFGGAGASKLTLELLFDRSEDTDGDVRADTDKLWKVMEVDQKFAKKGKKNSGRPPHLTFGWGATWTFEAVCEQLSVKFTMFQPNGTPIRATVTMSLTQVAAVVAKGSGGSNPKGQNPTTRALPGTQSRPLRDGDSLQSLAWEAYGDPNRWRLIAAANGIDDPFRLPRGRVLTIPPLPE